MGSFCKKTFFLSLVSPAKLHKRPPARIVPRANSGGIKIIPRIPNLPKEPNLLRKPNLPNLPREPNIPRIPKWLEAVMVHYWNETGWKGFCKCLKSGGQGRNRTADASLFRAALYQLSYLAAGQ